MLASGAAARACVALAVFASSLGLAGGVYVYNGEPQSFTFGYPLTKYAGRTWSFTASDMYGQLRVTFPEVKSLNWYDKLNTYDGSSVSSSNLIKQVTESGTSVLSDGQTLTVAFSKSYNMQSSGGFNFTVEYVPYPCAWPRPGG